MESHALSLVSERHAISGTRSQNDHAMAYAALASMADAVYCVDTAGCITFANTAFETMTGYALADLRGTASTRLFVPEAEALFTERRRQVYSGATVPPRVETVLLLEDGRRLPVELSVSSLTVEGRIAERIGVLRDLTERQALHDELERERAEAQRLEETLQQRSAQSALLSKATTELLATDDPLAFLEHLYDRLATLLDLEIYVHFALAPDGTHLKLAASRGFTPDQRDALRRLEFGQAVCGTVAQTCRPMIVTDVQNSNDPITEVIRALGITAYVCHPLLMGDALFGTLSFGTKTRPQFTDESVSLIRAISDLIAIAIARKQADAALQQANVELEQRVQERTAELQQAHDALRREMSERQRVQEALFQQEKLAALGTLLANVAHELNNPLAVAALQLDNLQEAWGFGAWSEDLETLRQAVERCKSVGQSFLALVRQQAPTRRAVALHVVIDDVLVLLGRSLEVDDITVAHHLAEDLPPLWADVNQLHHVLTNLITNAHHALRQTATPRHLRLTAAATADRSQVILEVADSGPGIPQELQRRILEPFFTTKSQGEGSGLGLPLCRNIVEGHGGTLQIASQAGHGTTVSVILPAATSEVEVAEASPEPLEPVQGQGRTILLIDDEPAMQRALRRLLQRNGYDITTAANGREGLAALKERSYEVILCDMRMPDLDGAGFYRELERCYPHLLSHVIFLTGDVLGPEAQAFFAQVDNPQLEKPFKAQDVRRVIQQVLEAR